MKRLFDILGFYPEGRGKPDMFAVKRSGRWQFTSSGQYVEAAMLTGIGLLAMGLKPGDRIATLATHNLPEWNFLDMGMSQIGVIHVPVYPYLSLDDMALILRQSEVRLVFVTDSSLQERISGILGKCSPRPEVYFFRKKGHAGTLQKIIALGKKNLETLRGEFNRIRESVLPEHTATLIYTSGTTGEPKGVMLTHSNLVSNILASRTLHPLGENDRVLSFLPLCHIYERTSNYQFQFSRTSIYYAEHFGTIAQNLAEIRADGFIAVPRVLEKIHEGFLAKGNDMKGIRKVLFKSSLRLTSRYRPDHRNSLWFRARQKIWHRLVFVKLHRHLGGKIRFIGLGGAPVSMDIEKFFWTAGLPVCQGYGLTETSPLISLNHFPLENHRLGTVGPVIPGVEVKISGEGEILCRGHNVMAGYYKDPEATSVAIDGEGWFHTGDLGAWVENRFLMVSGRKKEIFKNSYGKYVSPQKVEMALRESPFIDQVLVAGEGERFTSALIVPQFNKLRTWLKTMGAKVPFHPLKLISHPLVIRKIREEIDKCNLVLGDTEKVKKFSLVADNWGIKTGEITLSLKLRRKVLLERYRDRIRQMY